MYRVYPEAIAAEIGHPNLPNLIVQFIYDQQHSDCTSDLDTSSADLPTFYGKIVLLLPHSTHRATFLELVACVASTYVRWSPGGRDLVVTTQSLSTLTQLWMVCKALMLPMCTSFFLSLMRASNTPVPSYLGSHSVGLGDNTGMWIVKPDISDDGKTVSSIIHLDTVVRASHLLPVFGKGRKISKTLLFTDTLDTFTRFCVNKYADHHAFEIAFWFFLDCAWGAYIYSLDELVYLLYLTCFCCLFTCLHTWCTYDMLSLSLTLTN